MILLNDFMIYALICGIASALSMCPIGCVVLWKRMTFLGDAIAQLLAMTMPPPQEFVAVNDSFGESGTPEQLLTKYGLDTADVVAAAERAVARK
jgi:transketolase